MSTDKQDNLTAKQQDSNGLSRFAVFLPAISGFYSTFIGRQRQENYVDPARFPQGLTDMEQLNWLNSQKSLFPYRWSLYSGGHANLDLTKTDWSEDMVRQREPGTFILGDSGGFQIAKGLWEGDWRDPNSQAVQDTLAAMAAKGITETKNKKGKKVRVDHLANYKKRLAAAQTKREMVLNWLDNIADYGMIIDIPTWVIREPNASAACGISTLQEAFEATKFNNEYFIANRRGKENGGAKFLNVLQGDNHTSAETWYQEMKKFCDPVQYPGRHFDGWAMGGQNMCDVHLILKRLVALRYDNLLQPGVHDWMHFLGTSKLEWAVLLTVIQGAVRRYVNPNFTISFDCASPFLATANGQVYFENVYPDDDKWSYRMSPSADDKKYSQDTRPWSTGVLADGIHPRWQSSPVSNLLQMKDICYYQPGVLNKNGREPTTSWDSFSYALLMAHNVWMHITAVQEANRLFAAGQRPAMMQRDRGDYALFEDVVEAIFSAPDQKTANDVIENYSSYWTQIIGTRGFKGKKAINSRTVFNQVFVFDQSSVDNNSADSVVYDNGTAESKGTSQ